MSLFGDFLTIGANVGANVVTSKVAASEAAKQRAHDLKMAQLAGTAQEGGLTKNQMLMIAAGGLAVVGLILFKR